MNLESKNSQKKSKRATSRDVGELEYIYKIMKKINRTHDLEVIGRDVVENLVAALDCLGGALFIIDDENGYLRAYDYSNDVAAGVRLLPKPFRDYYFRLDEHDSLTVQSVLQKKMIIGHHTYEFWTPVLSRFVSRAIQVAVGINTFVTSPTIVAGKVMGVLMLGFSEVEISEHKKKLIGFFSDVCAVAFNNAKKYQSLQSQYKKMQEILAQQSDFIAVTAHEFRTPLSIAAFQMEDILEGEEDLNGKKKELDAVERSINNLKHLTEKLFAIQQHDLNKVDLRLERVDIASFLVDIHKEFEPLMGVKSIDFHLDFDQKKEIFLEMDKLQMRQVLHNILSNALKFTPKKGMVRCDLKVQRKMVYIIK